MGPIELLPPSSLVAQQTGKVLRAAHDFEALLISSLLRSFEQSFSLLPGQDKRAGDDDYHYLGTQALAAGLAASGGIGIGRLVASHLLPASGIVNTPVPPGRLKPVLSMPIDIKNPV